MFISAFTSVKLTFNATVKRRLRAVSQAFYCAERLPSILHDAQAPALGTVVGNKLFYSHYTVGDAVNGFEIALANVVCAAQHFVVAIRLS
jgi:hypothetical protein